MKWCCQCSAILVATSSETVEIRPALLCAICGKQSLSAVGVGRILMKTIIVKFIGSLHSYHVIIQYSVFNKE